MDVNIFEKTSDGIYISVEPEYLKESTTLLTREYFWMYHIRITNHSQRTIQLMNRYWKIIDAQGVIQEVEGKGVVGELPIIKPGHHYNYTSGVSLETASGMMMGSYVFTDTDSRESIDAEIPAFSLDSPESLAKPN